MNNSLSIRLMIPVAVLATGIILYLAQSLLIPLCYGLFIAIVLYPLCKWLELRKWKRGLAITVSLLLVLVLTALLLWILTEEISTFVKELPAIKKMAVPSLLALEEWITANLGFKISVEKIWLQLTSTEYLMNYLQIGVGEATNMMFMVFIVPVFTVLFLYNRERFVAFVNSIFVNAQINVQQILKQVIHTYFKFIKGMVLVYLIVGILNSTGLLLLGVEHALLFGMLTAILTIIPYVGIIIGAAIPMSLAYLSTGSLWMPLAIAAVFTFVQYLEANVIFPKVVGEQLNLNTWSVLVAILAGGIVWGVSGMILFIPFAGVLKILSQHIPSWKTLNILLSK